MRSRLRSRSPAIGQIQCTSRALNPICDSFFRNHSASVKFALIKSADRLYALSAYVRPISNLPGIARRILVLAFAGVRSFGFYVKPDR